MIKRLTIGFLIAFLSFTKVLGQNKSNPWQWGISEAELTQYFKEKECWEPVQPSTDVKPSDPDVKNVWYGCVAQDQACVFKFMHDMLVTRIFLLGRAEDDERWQKKLLPALRNVADNVWLDEANHAPISRSKSNDGTIIYRVEFLPD